MIEIYNVTKRYGDNLAVDDLTLSLQPNKVYGFLGPNGAGKSTTMNIITGYIGATSGQVVINGYDIYKEPEKAKAQIGYLPEKPPVYTDMTVSEYLEFVCRLKHIDKKKINREVLRVMKETGLTKMQDRLIRNLSKGYTQRVGIAQAIVSNPEFIIFDEPTVGLDPNQIIEIRDLIKKLSKTHTIILSSHILSEIQAVCDHVFIINHGSLIANDSIENISKMVNKTQVLEIKAKGQISEAKKCLNKIDDIDSVKIITADEPGMINITIKSIDNADVREDVSLALAKKGISIFEMKEDIQSLEDIFIELTKEDDNKKKTLAKKSSSKKKSSDEEEEED